MAACLSPPGPDKKRPGGYGPRSVPPPQAHRGPVNRPWTVEYAELRDDIGGKHGLGAGAHGQLDAAIG